jgi:hypothetical protein
LRVPENDVIKRILRVNKGNVKQEKANSLLG